MKTYDRTNVNDLVKGIRAGATGARARAVAVAEREYERGWALIEAGRITSALRVFERCERLATYLGCEFPALGITLAVLQRWRIDSEAADLFEAFESLDEALIGKVRDVQFEFDVVTFERLNLLLDGFCAVRSHRSAV